MMHTRFQMTAGGLSSAVAASALAQAIFILAPALLNQAFNVAATIGFALSGLAGSAASFVIWKVVGSIFGLGAQITFAGMVRLFSLRFANAIGIGLAFFSAQLIGAYVYFHEPFTTAQWAGTALVLLGILLIALGH